MATVTLATLRSRVRQIADAEVGATSSRIPDTELDAYINSACLALYDKLVDARGTTYYQTTASCSTVVGTSLYTWAALVATNFYRLANVLLWNGTEYIDVPPFGQDEAAALATASVNLEGANSYAIKYALQPTGIKLLPTPQSAAWTLNVYYIPSLALMTGPTDTFDGQNGWEEWAVLTAAIRCLIKDEIDPAPLMAERSLLDARIAALASSRNMADAPRIQNNRHDDYILGALRDDWDY